MSGQCDVIGDPRHIGFLAYNNAIIGDCITCVMHLSTLELRLAVWESEERGLRPLSRIKADIDLTPKTAAMPLWCSAFCRNKNQMLSLVTLIGFRESFTFHDCRI